MRRTLVTGPASEPVTLEEAKRRVRVEASVTADDEDLLTAIEAARYELERETDRALISQTWEGRLDNFPVSIEIELPIPPLQSVTSVKYIDTDGTLQTFSSSSYTVDTSGVVGRILLNHDASWPSTRAEPNAVRIVFVAGYGDDPEDVPGDLRRELWAKIGDIYAHREGTVTGVTATKLPDTGLASRGNRVGL